MESLSFCAWVNFLKMIISLSIHLLKNFTFLYSWILLHSVYMYYIFIMHWPVDGYLDYLYFLAIVNTVAKNMEKQVSL